MNFTELGIIPELETALEKEEITEPTVVQEASATPLLEGKDAYISSETGTGKTLAYLLPLISRLDLNLDALQMVIIAPTHELGLQVQDQVNRLVQNGGLTLKSMSLIGATTITRQKEKLKKKKPQLVIGSHGRILELIQLKKLKMHQVKSLVIDEADRLLKGDSLDSLQQIIASTQKDRQLILVSATSQKESSKTALQLSPDIVQIQARDSQVNQNIEHLYLVTEERKKVETLRKLIHAFESEKSIAFLHKNDNTDIVASKLSHHKLPVAQINGSCSKQERKEAMQAIRSGKARVLISSDLSARGIDIKGVTHIFNLDIPSKSNDYLHRVGRTGRAGQQGFAVSIMTPKETSLIKRYSKELNIQFKEAYLDHGKVMIKKSKKD